MNSFHIFSKVAVVVSLFVSASASSMEQGPTTDWTKKVGVGIAVGRNGFSYGCGRVTFTLLANQYVDKNDKMGNAAIQTAGWVVDQFAQGNEAFKAIIPANAIVDTTIHFGKNVAVRAVAQEAKKAGYTLDWLAAKCDILPAGRVRDYVNPVVRQAAEVATDPEVVICVVDQLTQVVINQVTKTSE